MVLLGILLYIRIGIDQTGRYSTLPIAQTCMLQKFAIYLNSFSHFCAISLYQQKMQSVLSLQRFLKAQQGTVLPTSNVAIQSKSMSLANQKQFRIFRYGSRENM